MKFEKLEALARDQGWRLRISRRGHRHVAFYPPNSEHVVHVAKSTDPRGIYNARAALRRAGLKV